MRRRDGQPVWVEGGGATAIRLKRVDLAASNQGSAYDEAWLQGLLHQNPAILPIDQIEPGFGSPVAVCRELPLEFGAGRSGALDNFMVTREGRLVLVEAKLWRNPEARRSVVAQAMEYSAAVFRLS